MSQSGYFGLKTVDALVAAIDRPRPLHLFTFLYFTETLLDSMREMNFGISFSYFLTALIMTLSNAHGNATSRPRAMVYRGPAACDDCPEAVGHLLETSPQNFEVIYAGPDEDVEVTAQSLRSVQLYAQPGGPGVLSLCAQAQQICQLPNAR